MWVIGVILFLAVTVLGTTADIKCNKLKHQDFDAYIERCVEPIMGKKERKGNYIQS